MTIAKNRPRCLGFSATNRVFPSLWVTFFQGMIGPKRNPSVRIVCYQSVRIIPDHRVAR